MLLDISNKKNLIVLDFSGYGNAYNNIKNNISENGFYLILRIKSSKENMIPGGKDTFNLNNPRSINPYNSLGIIQKNKWCSLVEYIYECDIVNPKSMLDFTLDYFIFKDGDFGKIFGEGTFEKSKLAKIKNNLYNSYTNSLSIHILTGLHSNLNKIFDERMDTEHIYQYIYGKNITNILSSPSKNILDKQSNSNFSITRIIGGYKQLSDGYKNLYANDKLGWKNNITLKNSNCNNVFSGGEYDLNNIIWCSLRSPRKTKVYKVGNNPNQLTRFVTNFIDLKDKNTCIGGGYGRYPNTIDLPRKTNKPLYSSSQNINTVNINNYDHTQNQDYYYTDNIERNINDIQYFSIYFKLLIPPDDGKNISLKYTFGKNTNSVMTFFRNSDMFGNPEPQGKSSLFSKRDNESITLIWDSSTINNNDIPIKTIRLLDIASGFSHHSAEISSISTDVSLNYLYNENNYDISCNIFQTLFHSKNAGNFDFNRNKTPYTIKYLDTIKNIEEQTFDISYVPINYEPYRYINYSNNIESNIYFTSSFNQPILIENEKLNYSPSKIYPINTDFFRTADVIVPSDNKNLEIKIIDISDSVDNNYNITPVKSVDNIEEFVVFIFPDLKNTIENNNKILIKNINQRNISFYEPTSLKLGSNFIPDYWYLPKKINDILSISRLNNSLNYNFFNIYDNQIKVSMLFELINVLLKDRKGEKTIRYILINSRENTVDFQALDTTGNLVDELFIKVQGNDGLISDPISSNPIDISFSVLNIVNNNSPIIDGTTKDITNINNISVDVTNILPNIFKKNNGTTITKDNFNGRFKIKMEGKKNTNFKDIVFNSLDILLVDISSAVQLNPDVNDMLSDDNNLVTIIWNTFDFTTISNWVEGDIEWSINRLNLSTQENKVLFVGNITPINNKYIFKDNDFRLFDKFKYTITGVYKWNSIISLLPNSNIPSINVRGFDTPEILICKFNRFPYGRFNSTSTNLKLYRPLLLNRPEGQVDQFGNPAGGGLCQDPNNPSKIVYARSSIISSSNNIYANTTNQVTEKQIYVELSNARFRPFR